MIDVKSQRRGLIYGFYKQSRVLYPQHFKAFILPRSKYGFRAVVGIPVSARGREILKEFISRKFPEVDPNWAAYHPEWTLPYLKD